LQINPDWLKRVISTEALANSMESVPKINRRNFIKATAIAGGGLLMSLNSCYLRKKNDSPVQVVPLLRIYPDNTIEVVLSKIEMGQGIWTTLPMLVAEELDCVWQSIKVTPRGSGTTKDFNESLFTQSTGGSDTTRTEFEHYRMVGATARTMLVYAASHRLKVKPEECITKDGYVSAGDKRLTYGELATEASTQVVPEIQLRDSAQWKIIGTSPQRLDIPEKINGSARYGIDVHVNEMCTAVICRPAVFGATLVSVDDTDCRKVTGVIDVLSIPSGVAVIADNFWSAKTGRDALNVRWETHSDKLSSSEAIITDYLKLAAEPGKVFMQKGNAIEDAGTVDLLEAEYIFPFLAHAPMETLNCTVKFDGERCQIWTGTQSPFLHQQEAATILGISPDKVEFNTTYIGGSFGRRGSLSKDYVSEAVYIAKICKRPVKVIWTREDDIAGGGYRPIYVHSVRIGLNATRMPVSWRHRIVGQSLFTGTLLEDALVKPEGFDYSSVDGINHSPYFSTIPDISLELHTTKLPISVLAWRSVGNTHTAFVMETMIDELADRAKVDVISYRRLLLKEHPRHLDALDKTMSEARWNDPLPPGRFKGIAIHEAMGSIICQSVEISVTGSAVNVHKVTCTIDCGLAVNPDGIRAQMEGSIIYGLTAALYGEIRIVAGKAEQSNFHDYPMLRMRETPEINVHILNGKGKMGGAGEPAVATIGPAVANAVFQATGKRIRQLPIRI
jgi:isoquinoline 1-oxidoreductase subunit beta